MYGCFLFKSYGYHLDLHVRSHPFPTRRTSDLSGANGAVLGQRAADRSDACGGAGHAGGLAAPSLLSRHDPIFLDDRDAHRATRSAGEIGRAHVCTPVTNAHLVCRLLRETKKAMND